MAPSRLAFAIAIVAASAGLVAADPNDWVNIDYVLKQWNATNTASARNIIVSKASSSGTSGPWSVVDKNGVLPPSGDTHDYLSWAPYHWPDCHWCSKGTNHLSYPGQGNNTANDGDHNTGDDGNNDTDDEGSDSEEDPAYEGGGIDNASVDANGFFTSTVEGSPILPRHSFHSRHGVLAHPRHRMIRRKRTISSQDDGSVSQEGVDPKNLVPTGTDDTPPTPTDTDIPDVGNVLPTLPGSQSSTTERDVYGTQAPAQAPAKTAQGSTCTPSPTKSIAPSATWTTCPYQVRDGSVNPDVSTLPNSHAFVSMSQSVLYNAVAYAVQKTKISSQNAVKFIVTWFLASSTAMNPAMNYGQLVRGPGKAHQMGSFTGILDTRASVKVMNAAMLLQAAGSPDWTPTLDKALKGWMKSFETWLENSALGKETAAKANNHVTFFVNQLAATKLFVGDKQGAVAVLKNYFNNQFKDQIARSGEQPFEAVRTRPYHYRAFNLEAMITNAKLGDQLGMDFWSAKSKYGATIQTALDFLLSVDPKNEKKDVTEICPHVAAVAAAYGDPDGKYAASLDQKCPGHKSQPYWFYDQSSALPNSPANRVRLNHRRDAVQVLTGDNGDVGSAVAAVMPQTVEEVAQIAFVCPDVFKEGKETELEDGLFVTCALLEPYFR